jgi:hypothetical protein
VAEGRPLANLLTGRTCGDVRVFLDPAGKWVGYTIDDRDRLRILRLDDLAEVWTTPKYCRAICSAGELFVEGEHHSWRAYDRSGRLEDVFLGLDWDTAFVPSFSPDGRLLAWGTLEGLVLVADLGEVRGRMEALGKRRK